MKKLLSVLVLIFSASFTFAGETCNKGEFIYEEPVEGVYTNGWSGIAVNDPLETKQANVYITGQGKTVEFHGILSINCTNNKSFWLTAKNFDYNESESIAQVPQKVLAGAAFLFCK